MLTWLRGIYAEQASPPDLAVFLVLCVAVFLAGSWAVHAAMAALLWAFGWRPRARLRDILLRPSFVGFR